MRLDVQHYINAVWGLIAIYWTVGIVTAKRTVKRESILSSALHVGLGMAAAWLVWDHDTAIGFLGYRFIPAADWVQWLGLGGTVCGCALAIWARTCLGSNWSAMVTVKQNHELILRGPYTVVRHPMYTGFLLALAGTAVAVGEIRALIGLGVAFISFYLKSATEEQLMHEQFAGEYARYSQRVRRLIPFIL